MSAQLDLAVGSRPLWSRISVQDQRAAALADGHYSRQTIGAAGFMPPGRRFALWHEGPLGPALWGVVLNLDPVGALRWRNTIFRNTSGTLSSSLIAAATIETYGVWVRRYGALPSVPLTTEVDIDATRARRSRHHEPGRCYRAAGWREIVRRGPTHGRPAIVVLAAPTPSTEAP